MKANELRIDNYILKEGDVIKVSASTLMTMQNKDFVNYSAIPLTEELLLKCGIGREKPSYECENYKLNSFHIKSGDRFYYAVAGVLSVVEIKHLHQLQNLYFAITGEELKIQL